MKEYDIELKTSDSEGAIQRIQQNAVFPHKIQVDKILDCRLLSSPLPIVKLRCEMK